MNLEPDNKLGYLQQLYKMHQWNHNQPEKSSISDGLETSHSKMKPELMSNRGSSSLQPDDATPLTLFQTPLMQAAIRQQQMQFFTQLANLGYPFLPMSGSVQPMAHPPVQPFTHSYSPFSNCKTKSQNTSFITNSPKFLTPTFSATQPDLSLNCSKSDVLTSTTTFTSKLTSNKSSKQNFGYRCPDSNLSSSSLDMRNKDIDLSSSVTTSSMAQSITSARKRPRSSHKGNLSLNGGSLDGPSGKEKVTFNQLFFHSKSPKLFFPLTRFLLAILATVLLATNMFCRTMSELTLEKNPLNVESVTKDSPEIIILKLT